MTARFSGWVAALALTCHAAPAATVPLVGFDSDQARIIQAATNEMIARIDALKPGHPPLAEFGSASCFHRFPGGFRYDYKVETVRATDARPLQERPLPGGCFIYSATGRRCPGSVLSTLGN